MATLASLPFKLEFKKKSVDDNRFEEIILNEFYESVFDLKKQHKPELRILENRSLYAKILSSNMNAVMDMDGFDGVDNVALKHADGNYLTESDSYTKLFDGTKFPLPPGLYVIKVTVNRKAYFTGFEVVSAVLEDYDIWQSMLSDIIACVPRQTVDYAYIRSVAKQFAYNEVTPHMLWKMMVLNNEYARVIAALNDIRHNPHNRLVKKHVLVNKNRIRNDDARAKQSNINKCRFNYKAYVPKKILSFDLLENRFFKLTLLSLNHRIQQCLDEANKDMSVVFADLKNIKYKSHLTSPEYIRKCKVNDFLTSESIKLEKLQSAVRMLLKIQWIKDLPAFKGPFISTQNFSDPRYNIIFSLFSKLDKISKDYSNDKHLTLLWKRTSLMYEYWNIILLVKSLISYGFILYYSDVAKMLSDRILFKELNSGCNFSFKSKDGRYILKLYYEKEVPRVNYNVSDEKRAERNAQKNTNKYSQPLYTKKANNTPDCIIDCYECDELGQGKFYLGSLIVDFKYRKRSSLWNDNQEYVYKDFRNTGYEYDSCANQLKAYKDMRTIFFGDCDGLEENISDRFIKPVHEVWALYPNVENPKSVEFKSGYGIRFVPSIPGNEDVLQKQLKNFLEWLMPGLT